MWGEVLLGSSARGWMAVPSNQAAPVLVVPKSMPIMVRILLKGWNGLNR